MTDQTPQPAKSQRRAAELAEPSEEARPRRLATRAPLDVRRERSPDQPPMARETTWLSGQRPQAEPLPPLSSDDLDPDPAIAKRLADLKQDDSRERRDRR